MAHTLHQGSYCHSTTVSTSLSELFSLCHPRRTWKGIYGPRYSPYKVKLKELTSSAMSPGMRLNRQWCSLSLIFILKLTSAPTSVCHLPVWQVVPPDSESIAAWSILVTKGQPSRRLRAHTKCPSGDSPHASALQRHPSGDICLLFILFSTPFDGPFPVHAHFKDLAAALSAVCCCPLCASCDRQVVPGT